jgi:hypothetical protein
MKTFDELFESIKDSKARIDPKLKLLTDELDNFDYIKLSNNVLLKRENGSIYATIDDKKIVLLSISFEVPELNNGFSKVSISDFTDTVITISPCNWYSICEKSSNYFLMKQFNSVNFPIDQINGAIEYIRHYFACMKYIIN